MERQIKYERLWLKQLAEGNEKAYQCLFDSYYSSLVMFASKYLQDLALAEDLVQDVIYDLWNQRQNLSDLSSLKNWLFVSVRNRCLNYLEHLKVEKKYVRLHRETESDFFLQQLIEEEVYAALKGAVNELPPKIRQVYQGVLAGKTNAEIAAEMGISEEAVKAFRKRGKKILRLYLSDLLNLILFFY
ncbi:MAG: RNA polymerase sigma-70 factor [Odoribacter sp.]|nr:RNA polymerase sigma-70 factor [Odoribacter sp.]